MSTSSNLKIFNYAKEISLKYKFMLGKILK